MVARGIARRITKRTIRPITGDGGGCNEEAVAVVTTGNLSLTYGVAFWDENSATNNPTAWQIAGLPVGTGIVIDNRGNIFGVPSQADIAASPITASVTARNCKGTSDAVEITITVAANVYVDSVAGNDGNAGTLAAPYATLAAAEADATDNFAVALKAGSVFQGEDWVLSTERQNTTLVKYGTGDDPVIDCSTTLDESTATRPDAAGEPNVWLLTHSSAGTFPAYPGFVVDDVPLRRVRVTATGDSLEQAVDVADEASALAYVQANTGFFYVKDNAGDHEYYFHSTTDPTSNGSTYKASLTSAVLMPSNDSTGQFSVNNVKVINGFGRNGVFGSNFPLNYISRGLTVRNANGLHAQLIGGRYWEDCDVEALGNRFFSNYHLNSPSDGAGAAYVNCRSVNANKAFYNHDNSQANVVIKGATVSNCAEFADFRVEGVAASGALYVIDSKLNNHDDSPRLLTGAVGTIGSNNGFASYYENCVFYGTYAFLQPRGSVIKFHNCRFYVRVLDQASPNGSFMWVNSLDRAVDIEFENCSIYLDHETNGLTTNNDDFIVVSTDATGSSVVFKNCNLFSNASNLDTGSGTGIEYKVKAGTAASSLSVDFTTYPNHVHAFKNVAVSSTSSTMFAADPVDGDWSLNPASYSAINDLGWKADRATKYTTAANAVIASAAAPPITNTVKPAITGDSEVSVELTSSTGTWSDERLKTSYQWLRDGADISGETSSTYTVATGDLGNRINPRVHVLSYGGTAYADATPALITPFTGLLMDIFPAITEGFSLRKLRKSYSGAAIRVRRSSDDAEQDIGFVNNELDTESLLSFCGSGDGFVVTMYGQKETANVTNATTSEQKKIVNAGSLITENTKQAISSATNQPLRNTSTDLVNPIGSFSVFSVCKKTDIGSAAGEVFRSKITTRFTAAAASVISSSLYISYNGTDANRNILVSSGDFDDLGSLAIMTHIFKGSGNVPGFWVNASEKTIASGTQNFSTSGNTGFEIFRDFAGPICEIVICDTDQSANQAAIESALNEYYGAFE